MTLEESSAAFIAPFEAAGGPVLKSYRDIAGVWTIGYGTTFFLNDYGAQVPVTEGLVWTAAQCMAALARDVSSAVAVVIGANVWHPWSENEIVALTSLCYNIGATSYRSSTVLREHNLGDRRAAAQAFLLWDKAHVDGKLVTVEGLLNRRKAEAQRYLS